VVRLFQMSDLLPARLVCTVLIALGSFLASPTHAEVIVYTLSFDDTGTSVNDPNIESAIIVLDDEALTFSTIAISPDPVTGRLSYTTGLIAGSYFELQDAGDGDIFAVLTGNGAGDANADIVSLQVVGKVSNNVDIGPGTSARIAKKMKGVFFYSEAEAFVTDDNDTTTLEPGFAASKKATARFDQATTRDANDLRLDAATTITAITETLERRGINSQTSPSPTASPSVSIAP